MDNVTATRTDDTALRCEVLVAVKDPQRRSWWLWLLSSSDGAIFNDGGRLRPVDEDRAVSAARLARLRGYTPILLCPSKAAKRRLAEALPLHGEGWCFLVAGVDDAAIRALLLRPSRDVLLAYIRGERLQIPDNAYREALERQVAADPMCRKMRERLRSHTLYAEDFELVTEPDEPGDPYVLSWILDPLRTLELVPAKSLIMHKLSGEGRADVLLAADHKITFNDGGFAEPGDAAWQALEAEWSLPLNAERVPGSDPWITRAASVKRLAEPLRLFCEQTRLFFLSGPKPLELATRGAYMGPMTDAAGGGEDTQARETLLWQLPAEGDAPSIRLAVRRRRTGEMVLFCTAEHSGAQEVSIELWKSRKDTLTLAASGRLPDFAVHGLHISAGSWLVRLVFTDRPLQPVREIPLEIDVHNR